MHHFNIPLFKNTDALISVFDNTMSPKYLTGDILAVQFIDKTDFIQWNKPYAIGSKNQGLLLKRVQQSSDRSKFTLISENKDYGDFDITFEDIKTIAIVRGVVRLE